jgi:DNA-binding beta-propeller fold protein YncE
MPISNRFVQLVLLLLVVAATSERSAAAIAVEPSTTLLVAHKWDDSVGFYNAVTGELETVVPIGRRPHELALSHDGTRVYATLYGIDLYTETAEGGRSVAILDVPHRLKLGEIDLGKYRRPHGIAIGRRSGLLYVTCDHPAALLILDPKQNTVAASIELTNSKSLCHMVTVSHDERTAYVANCGTADVAVIDLIAGREVNRIAVGGIPMGMTLSNDGKRLWATTRTANALAVIDTAAQKIERMIELAGHPVRTTLTPDGRHLLVTLIDSGEVAVVDTTVGMLLCRIPIGKRVEGLSVDAAGKFGYASAQADDKVVRFSLNDWKPVLEIHTPKRPDPLVTLP